MGVQTRPYSRAQSREAVCAVTESSSASPGSTSGASATSASRNFLIDLSSFAQTALTQRLNAMIKTTVRIMLEKLAKTKRELYQITNISNDTGARCVEADFLKIRSPQGVLAYRKITVP